MEDIPMLTFSIPVLLKIHGGDNDQWLQKYVGDKGAQNKGNSTMNSGKSGWHQMDT